MGNAIPVTLYWQTLSKGRQKNDYKYIVQLVETLENGQTQIVGVTEREPYNGNIRTSYWDPGKILLEETELTTNPAFTPEHAGRYQLVVQIYDKNTLEKLPVTRSQGATVSPDQQMLRLAYLPR